jgi:Leucine-rich repeat (LRR) protein
MQALPERLQQTATARVIDADGNMLTKLPSWIGIFGDTLHRLVLSNNRLECLPTELNQLQHLKTLVVAHNRLDALPVDLNLPRLELLDVSHNNLVKLTAGISRSRNLRELRASSNHLDVIPLQLGGCIALQHADFAKNALSVRSWPTCRMHSLCKHQCDLTHHFAEHQVCTVLCTLRLISDVQALPVELSKLQKLQHLNLDDNKISAIPPPIFFGCTSLQTLTLHGCPVTIKVNQHFSDHGVRCVTCRQRHMCAHNPSSLLERLFTRTQDLEGTQGFAEFELRRRKKFSKHIASNTMFPIGGMQESASRA